MGCGVWPALLPRSPFAALDTSRMALDGLISLGFRPEAPAEGVRRESKKLNLFRDIRPADGPSFSLAVQFYVANPWATRRIPPVPHEPAQRPSGLSDHDRDRPAVARQRCCEARRRRDRGSLIQAALASLQFDNPVAGCGITPTPHGAKTTSPAHRCGWNAGLEARPCRGPIRAPGGRPATLVVIRNGHA